LSSAFVLLAIQFLNQTADFQELRGDRSGTRTLRPEGACLCFGGIAGAAAAQNGKTIQLKMP
jgi:hypothetical protein